MRRSTSTTPSLSVTFGKRSPSPALPVFLTQRASPTPLRSISPADNFANYSDFSGMLAEARAIEKETRCLAQLRDNKEKTCALLRAEKAERQKINTMQSMEREKLMAEHRRSERMVRIIEQDKHQHIAANEHIENLRASIQQNHKMIQENLAKCESELVNIKKGLDNAQESITRTNAELARFLRGRPSAALAKMRSISAVKEAEARSSALRSACKPGFFVRRIRKDIASSATQHLSR